MLKIDEFFSSSGELSSVCLRVEGAGLEIVADTQAWPLPSNAVRAVLVRFGAPFDRSARSIPGDRLGFGQGQSLQHVRHLAGYDVIARDYLVYEEPDAEPLCALATTVASALLHLGKANGAR
jgi:hypothetical protein